MVATYGFDETKFLRLFLALTSMRRAWWSVPELMEASGYSRAAVYRNLARLESLHLGMETAQGVLPGKPCNHMGWRCNMVLMHRVRS
jgi:hypothetical protein